MRFILNLTGPVIETITTEAGQDPVMRCERRAGEERRWRSCACFLCAKKQQILQDNTSNIEQLERLYSITREGDSTSSIKQLERLYSITREGDSTSSIKQLV